VGLIERVRNGVGRGGRELGVRTRAKGKRERGRKTGGFIFLSNFSARRCVGRRLIFFHKKKGEGREKEKEGGGKWEQNVAREKEGGTGWESSRIFSETALGKAFQLRAALLKGKKRDWKMTREEYGIKKGGEEKREAIPMEKVLRSGGRGRSRGTNNSPELRGENPEKHRPLNLKKREGGGALRWFKNQDARADGIRTSRKFAYYQGKVVHAQVSG